MINKNMQIELVNAALAVRDKAHAPYSDFKVKFGDLSHDNERFKI